MTDFPTAPYGLLSPEHKAIIDAAWRDGVEWWAGHGWTDDMMGFEISPHKTYRPKPEPLRPMSPPWEHIRDDIISVAMDKNGDAWGYRSPPMLGDGAWAKSGGYYSLCALNFDRGNMPWNRSLVMRPKEGE